MSALRALSDWLNVAHTGDQFVYWRTTDQSDWANRRAPGIKASPRQRDYADTLKFASELNQLGRIALFQRKNAEWQHEWVAVRLSEKPPARLVGSKENRMKRAA